MVFANLHNHSEYSFLGSLIRISDLASFASRNGFGACALTDTHSTFGYFKLANACKSLGIKPVFGIELFVKGLNGKGHYPVRFIALDDEGMKNIYHLNSESFARYADKKNLSLPFESLAEHGKGLAVLADSEFYFYRDDPHHISRLYEKFSGVYGERFFMEINYTGPASVGGVKDLIAVAERLGISCAATAASRHFPDEKESFRLLNLLREKTWKDERGIPLDPQGDYSVKSRIKFDHVFQNHPDFLENAAKLIDSVRTDFDTDTPRLPVLSKNKNKLSEICFKALDRSGCDDDRHRSRLESELDTICRMGLENYFLFIADLSRINHDRYLAGSYGTGDFASSLVSFLLGWTEIDPVNHGLPFESFVYEGMAGLPPVTVDAGHRNAERLANRIVEKFGKNNTAFVAPVSRYKPRQMIRDFGRIAHIGSKKIDEIIDLIPYRSPESLKSSVQNNPKLSELYRKDPEIRDLFNHLFPLENLANHKKSRAGSKKIAALFPKGVRQFASLENARDDDNLVQIDPDDLERSGFLKVHIHTDRQVSALQDTMHRTKLQSYPQDDPQTYVTLSKGDTLSIPVLESSVTRDMLRKTQPKTFEQLGAVIAMNGIGFIRSGIALQYSLRQAGMDNPVLTLPIENSAGDTYGLFVYREQILDFCVRTVGFDWKDAHRFLEAIATRDGETSEAMKESFLKGCENSGMPLAEAEEHFVWFVNFGFYTVGKADALVRTQKAYLAAYLKTRYPKEYYLSQLNTRIDSGSRLNAVIGDMKQKGIELRPVDINASGVLFRVEQEAIRAGLLIVKHVGGVLARIIVKERTEHGDFKDPLDFTRRIRNSTTLAAKSFAMLAMSGAFDGISQNATRKALTDSAEILLDAGRRTNEDADLFHLDKPVKRKEYLDYVNLNAPKMTAEEIIDMEMESTDLFLTKHPIETYWEELPRFKYDSIADTISKSDAYAVFIGYVHRIRIVKTRDQNDMAFATISDLSGSMDIVLFPSVFHRYRNVLKKPDVYLAKGVIQSSRLKIEEIFLFANLTGQSFIR